MDQNWENPASWTDWATRLRQNLLLRDQQYMGFKGIEQMRLDPDTVGNDEVVNTDPRANATMATLAALHQVVEALKELPQFQDESELIALRTLIGALIDVTDGRQHQMFTPRPDQKPAKDRAGRILLQTNVIFYVELLQASGEKNASRARKDIATVFAAAGHTGRKKAPLGAGTIYDWVGDIADGRDPHARVLIDEAHGQWRVAHGWPPKREQVLDGAKLAANDPFLLAQI